MKKNIYIIVSIIILSTCFYFQYKYLVNNTVGTYVLDYKKKYVTNDNSFELLHENTMMLLSNIEKSEKENIIFLFNSNTIHYNETGLGYLIARTDALPMYMPKEADFFHSINYDKDYIKMHNLDYILIMGKNTKIYDETTTNDYTLYKVIDKKNNKLKEVASVKYGLLDIYKDSLKTKNSDKINYYVKKYQEQIIDTYNVSAIDAIKKYCIDLYNEGYYDESIKQSNFYLKHVYLFDSDLNLILGNIYKERKQYGKSYTYYNNCTYDVSCDLVEVKKQMNYVKEKGGF